MTIPPPDDDSFDQYADATGKGDLHIPGAGTIGVYLLLASLSVLFIASIVAFLIIRVQSPEWPPPGFPHVPSSLWISTLIIVGASVTIQFALNAIRRDDEKRLRLHLLLTFILGLLFLLLQTVNWLEFYSHIRGSAATLPGAGATTQGIRLEGAYLGMFFVLTGLHAAHVVGGLIPLTVVMYKARPNPAGTRYSRNFHPGVRYVTLYWHFLDIVWIILFCVLWF
jgi:cytochrome c oxidase subunit III